MIKEMSDVGSNLVKFSWVIIHHLDYVKVDHCCMKIDHAS